MARAVVAPTNDTRSFWPLPLRTNRLRSCGFQCSISNRSTSVARKSASAMTRIVARSLAPTNVAGQRARTARSSSSVGTSGSVAGVLMLRPAKGVADEDPGGLQPQDKGLQGPVGLVDCGGAQAPLAEPGEESDDGRSVERGDVVTHVGPDPVQPPSIDADSAVAAPGHGLADQECFGEVGERLRGFGVSLCFICYFRGC